MNLASTVRLNRLAIRAGNKRTVALDFDGVIHQYTGDHTKMGPPVKGAIDAIKKLQAAGMEVVIYSARPALQIRRWLVDNKFPALKIATTKPAAIVYLDDRGVQFNGKWTPALIERLVQFTPYWEKQVESTATGSEYFQTAVGLAMVPQAHPPSLRNPQHVKQDTATDGWKHGASKQARAKAKEDLAEVLKRLRRQTGKPELAQTAAYPIFPSIYTPT